jgi:hypothetical protein
LVAAGPACKASSRRWAVGDRVTLFVEVDELDPHVHEVLGRGMHRVSTRRSAVARRTLLVSDLSGEEIPEGAAATITIRFADARKGTVVLDVTEEEAEALGAKGRRQARRGRPRRSEGPGYSGMSREEQRRKP